jgi:hypothetical protein
MPWNADISIAGNARDQAITIPERGPKDRAGDPASVGLGDPAGIAAMGI